MSSITVTPDQLESVLIFAPTGQDARLISSVLEKRRFHTEIFNEIEALGYRMREDCGAVIIAEEGLTPAAVHLLGEELSSQGVWSDLPLIIMTSPGASTDGIIRILNAFGQTGNIILVERPLRPITLESTVEVALRARRKQYQVRALLKSQMEATRVREEFISVASHELRTPLTSLKLMTQMNQRMMNGKSPVLMTKEKVNRLIEFTDAQVGRLTRLVEDMLDVSKIGSGKFIIRKSDVDFAKLVEEAVDRIESELLAVGCQLEVELPESLVMCIDQDRIEQVVTNLLTNIIRYAPGSAVKIALEKQEQKVLLTVSDQGPGIPEDRQDKVFDRFERATSSKNISGLGLGLYICRQIVNSHDGAITLESGEGHGTTFRVTLPIQSAS